MPAATVNRFAEALSQCTFLPEEQREQLPELSEQCEDARQLAQEVLRRGWLTAYQINHVAQGRAAELVLGPYVMLERIGSGGMGQVFKARQTSLHRLVALKVIRPECLANQRVIRRFLREIRAASQLSHPNVVAAYDADQIAGANYIAMEYVDGIDLARLVKQSGPLAVWLACDLVRQAALGLQHAFEHGLIHRDIKPANLLLAGIKNQESSVRSQGSGLKITDFGLARWTDDDPERPISHLTQVGSVLGTPEFISPEQTRNSSTCDIRADLYSLGCTFYYLLAGQVPFPNGTLTDKLLAHQLDQAESVGKARRARLSAGLGQQGLTRAREEQLDVPAAVEHVVVKLLAKRPEERYQTPAELAAVLANVQERLSRGALPVPPRPQPETLVEFDLTPRPVSPAQPGSVIDGVLVEVGAVATRAPSEVARGGSAKAAQPAVAPQRRRLWPWMAAAALLVIPLAGLAGGFALLAAWSSGSRTVAAPDADRADAADELQWNKLLGRHKKQSPAAMRGDLFAFRTQFPGSPHLREADEWLMRLPSPFDKLDRVMVPKVPLVTVKSTTEMVGVLGEHRGYFSKPASIVAVSPDGRWLLGSEDPGVRLWDTAELAKPPARFQPHPKRMHAAAFSPDGKRLATAGDDANIHLWDPSTRERTLSLAKHQGAVTRLAFSRGGKWLASAGGDGKIWLWDAATGSDRASLAIGNDDVQSVAFSIDGETLFWGTRDQVRWTRVAGGALSAGKPSELAVPGPARVLAFAADGQTLLCGGGKGVVVACAWDGRKLVERGRLLHEVLIGKNPQSLQVNDAVFTPDGKSIATACSDHRVRIWDARGLSLQKEWDLQCPVVSTAVALDGRHLITGNGNSTLTIFRLAALPTVASK